MGKGFLLVGILATVLSVFLGFSASAEQTKEGVWEINQTVDDFGDVTEDSETYITTTVEGTFSNTATTDGNLKVVIYYIPDEDPSFSFRLLEYDNTPATYFDDSEMRILFKVNDDVYEHYLIGTAPNGDVYLSDYGELKVKFDQEEDNMTTKEKITLNNQMLEPDLPLEESGVKQVTQFLSNGDDIRFVIYIDSSKYSFSIDAAGFLDMANKAHIPVYDEAKTLMEEGDYKKAEQLFRSINYYLDSEDLANQCVYDEAKELMQEGNYIEAEDILRSIDPFLDSEELINQCIYGEAVSYFEKEDYKKAREEFDRIRNYSDSKERIIECDERETEKIYNDALALMENEQYSEAKEVFDTLGDYLDSKERIVECEEKDIEKTYNEAVSLLNNEEYSKAKTKFLSIGDYMDAEEKAKQCEQLEITQKEEQYKDACGLLEGGNVKEAYSIFIKLGSYEDAEAKVQECEELIQQEENYTSIIDKYVNGEPIDIREMIQEVETLPKDYKDNEGVKEMISLAETILNNHSYIREEKGDFALYIDGFTHFRLVHKTSLDLEDVWEAQWVFEKGAAPYIIGGGYYLLINSANSITAKTISGYHNKYEGNYVYKNDTELNDFQDPNVIKKVQEALNNAGYDCGNPDGDKGPKTTSVIQQYQTDNGLEATGEIDDALLSSLRLK